MQWALQPGTVNARLCLFCYMHEHRTKIIHVNKLDMVQLIPIFTALNTIG
jgi:hypothetical protein